MALANGGRLPVTAAGCGLRATIRRPRRLHRADGRLLPISPGVGLRGPVRSAWLAADVILDGLRHAFVVFIALLALAA